MEDEELWISYFVKKLSKNIHNEKKIDWKLVSTHPYVPIHLVKKFPHMPWDWHNLSKISFHNVQVLLCLFPFKEWDWNYLSSHFPICFIQNNPTLKWNHDKISIRNHNHHKTDRLWTPLEFALKNVHMPWNWSLMSRHPSMNMDHIIHYPYLSWDMNYILKNCYFSSYHLGFITTSNKNYHFLSQNPHNTISILRKNSHKPWDWTELAKNIAFAPHYVYPYKEELPLWRWDLSLRNPRLTWVFYDFIRREITIPRQFYHLLKNHFQYTNTFFVYFMIVIRRFLMTVMRRRLIKRKLRLLATLKSRIDPYILQSILFHYIG